jgi:hypothetical protein
MIHAYHNVGVAPVTRVNRTWTKRNDHAPKNEYVDFFNICPNAKTIKSSLTILLSSLVLIFSSPFFLINFF